MAFLKEIESGARIPLKVHHVFGRRQDTADTHIAHESVSKLHAAIEWNGEGWQLRSFGRNGSWVNQRGLETGSRHELLKGDVLHFGDCQGAGWQVADLRLGSGLDFCLFVKNQNARPDSNGTRNQPAKPHPTITPNNSQKLVDSSSFLVSHISCSSHSEEGILTVNSHSK